MLPVNDILIDIKKYNGKLSEKISQSYLKIQEAFADFNNSAASFKVKNQIFSSVFIEKDDFFNFVIRFVFNQNQEYIHYYYNPHSNIKQIYTKNASLSFMKEMQDIIENNSSFFDTLFEKGTIIYNDSYILKLEFTEFIKNKATNQRPDIMKFLKKHSLNKEEITQLIPKVKNQENFKIVSIYLKNNKITVDYIYLDKWNKFDLNKSKTYFSVELDIDSNNNYESLSSTFRKHPVLKLVDIYKDNYSDYFVNLDTTLENINLATNIELF